jgi:Leucine-rich repeat (LRR) protein
VITAYLRGSEIPSLSLRCLPSLIHLDLGRNKLQTISGRSLSSCQLLQSLILSQNELIALPAPLFLPNLKQFWCSGNKLTSLSAWVALPALSGDRTDKGSPVFLPMLEKLHLQDNAIEAVNPGVFCTMPNLNQLDLSFNSLSSINSISGLAIGLQPFALKQLQLQDNPVTRTTDPTRVLNDSEVAKTIRKLHLWLAQACPGLSKLSNNKFPPDSEVEGFGKLPASTVEDVSTGLLSHHSRTGTWSVHNIRNRRVNQRSSGEQRHVSTGNAQAAKRSPSFEEAVKMQSLAARDALSAGALDQIVDVDGLQNGSLESRMIINVMNVFTAEQNSWRARERSSQAIKDNPHGSVPDDTVVEVMHQQVKYLQALGRQLLRSQSDLSYWVSDDAPDNSGAIIRCYGTHAKDMYFISHALYVAHKPTVLAQLQFDLEKVSSSSQSADRPEHRQEGVEGSITESAEGLGHDSSVSDIIGNGSAVTSLQRFYRGSRTRRLLNNALDSAKYIDEELESLGLTYDGDGSDMMKEMGLEDLLKGEELDPNWIRVRSLASNSDYQDEVSTAVHEEGESEDDEYGDSRNGQLFQDQTDLSVENRPSSGSLVYGDLQRRRGSRSHVVNTVENINYNSQYNPEAATAAWGTPPPSSEQQHFLYQQEQRHQSSSVLPQSSKVSTSVSESPYLRDSVFSPRSHTSRPMSSSTDVSGIGSRMDSSRLDYHIGLDSESSHIPTVVTGGPSNRGAVAEDWGINDPHLLNALMKRNKRMRWVLYQQAPNTL